LKTLSNAPVFFAAWWHIVLLKTWVIFCFLSYVFKEGLQNFVHIPFWIVSKECGAYDSSRVYTSFCYYSDFWRITWEFFGVPVECVLSGVSAILSRVFPKSQLQMLVSKMELQIEDDAWSVFCKDAILEPSWL
jgi:hypothetical protein